MDKTINPRFQKCMNNNNCLEKNEKIILRELWKKHNSTLTWRNTNKLINDLNAFKKITVHNSYSEKTKQEKNTPHLSGTNTVLFIRNKRMFNWSS